MSCKGGFLDIVKELTGKISDAWLEKFDDVYADLTKNTYDPTQWHQNLDETLTDLQKIFNRVDVLNLKEYELTDEDLALMDTVKNKLDFDETQFQNILKNLSTLQAALEKVDGLKLEDLVNVSAIEAGKIPKGLPDRSGIFWVDPESASNIDWGGIRGALENQTDLATRIITTVDTFEGSDTEKLKLAMQSGKTIFLQGRDYIVTEPLGQMAENTSIIGQYGRSKIKLADNFVGDYLIKTNHKTLLANFEVEGDLNVEPNWSNDLLTQDEKDNNTDDENVLLQIDRVIALTGVGTTNGIIKYGTNAQISRLNISLFSGIALHGVEDTLTDGRVYGSLFHKSGIGIKLDGLSEYNQYIANQTRQCLYGTVVTGGNNSFSIHKSRSNRVGIMILGGDNSAHGDFTGGSVNSNSIFALVADNIKQGEHFGNIGWYHNNRGIYIRKSAGINIFNSQIESSIYVEGAYQEAGLEGINRVENNTFITYGGNLNIHENFNEVNSGKSNLSLKNNRMREENSSNTWDNSIVNNTRFDDNHFERIDGTTPIISGAPIGGKKYIGDGSVLGALRIELPVGFNYSYFSFDIKIVDQNGNGTNMTVYATSSTNGNYLFLARDLKGGKDYKVRAGSTADGKIVLYIGELNTSWRYATVIITNFATARGAFNKIKDWSKEWTIATESNAFENVTKETELSQDGTDFTGDLDTIATNRIVYAASATNSPVATNGMCTTLTRASSSAVRTQEYCTVTGEKYVRGTYQGDTGWSAWSKCTP